MSLKTRFTFIRPPKGLPPHATGIVGFTLIVNLDEISSADTTRTFSPAFCTNIARYSGSNIYESQQTPCKVVSDERSSRISL